MVCLIRAPSLDLTDGQRDLSASKGMPEHPPVTREKAVNVLAKLLREGYEDQILIGNDACCWQTVVRFETEENSPELYTK